MEARIDAIGNVVGRYEGDRPGLPALFLGSHLDTVRDAGKYDGPLGVITAIACVDSLNRLGIRLPFAIEIIGFSDEEGVRFGATMLGSEAVAGMFDAAWLSKTDDAGVTMRDAMAAYGLDPDAVGNAARRRATRCWLMSSCISSKGRCWRPGDCRSAASPRSAGATRYRVELTGTAGHAGTVPMGGRRDALGGGGGMRARGRDGCVRERPGWSGPSGGSRLCRGAVNVIPGRVRFTIDIRAPVDAQRERAVAAVLKRIIEIAVGRTVGIETEKLYEMPAAPCAPWLMDQIDRGDHGGSYRAVPTGERGRP